MDKEEGLVHGQFQGIVNDAQRRSIKLRQKNEYIKQNRRMEGLCWCCDTNDFVMPTLLDCCHKCADKRGVECIIAIAAKKPYGYCLVCGNYTWNVAQLNVQLCTKCTRHVRTIHKKYRKGGGMFNMDPFWQYQKVKNGHDWAMLFGLDKSSIIGRQRHR